MEAQDGGSYCRSISWVALLRMKPVGMKDEEWVVLERKVRSLIRLYLVDLVLLNVFEEKTTTLQKKLGDFYQAKSLVNKLFFYKKLFSLRMGDGDSVTEHMNAFNTIVTQLISIEVKMDEEDSCITLFYSLPNSWDNLVMAIGSIVKTLVLDEVVFSLL